MNKKTITAGQLLDERMSQRYVSLFSYVGKYDVKSLDFDTMNDRYVIRSNGQIEYDYPSTEPNKAAVAYSELSTD